MILGALLGAVGAAVAVVLMEKQVAPQVTVVSMAVQAPPVNEDVVQAIAVREVWVAGEGLADGVGMAALVMLDYLADFLLSLEVLLFLPLRLAVSINLLGLAPIIQPISTSLAQPIITVADISCTGTNVKFATSDGSPHNWNFGAGATPATSTNSPENVQYSTTGRKTITYDSYVYTDFWNILISNAAPTITASATSICVGGSLTFTTDLIGINYQWQVATDAAFSTVVGTGSTQTFTYTFTSAGTYYIWHRRYTDCCGWGAWSNVITVTVHPLPAAPTASGLSPVRRGAALVYTATAPAGVTFEWYTAATGGLLTGTGITLTIPFTIGFAFFPANYNNPGTYTLYVEAVSPQGCRSSRTPVSITVNATTAPTVSPVSRCGPGPVVLVANYAGPGTPTYNWWDGPSAGATLLQTGGSNTFTTTVTTSTTFYVSVQVPGCVESARVPVTVTVTAAPTTDTWTGAVSSDWFNPNNWASGWRTQLRHHGYHPRRPD